MIKNIGIDIVEISRFDNFVTDPRYIKRFLSLEEIRKFEEITHIEKKKEYMASRFAAKEALIKASGINFIFNEVSILNKDDGAPFVKSAVEFGKVFISLSHSNKDAIAFIVIEN